MEKIIKKRIIIYKDGTSVINNFNGILTEQLNSGWKLINTAKVPIENSDPEIESITEYNYLLRNDSGLIIG